MEEKKNSVGPWFVTPADQWVLASSGETVRHGRYDISAGSANVEDAAYYRIASVSNVNGADANLANAYVIAAAPELLAACRAQHEAIDVLMARLIALDPEFFPTRSSVWPAALQGVAAIAKATGSAS